ncbi:MAG: hypothetical protein ACPGYT_05440 [Nitrospirales bacterium]
MPVVWCSITGHGFGHAAQLVPILNELGKRIPDLHVILRTTVPITFFQETLMISWEHSFSQQDIGCIQDDPLHIDIAKTWRAYEEFHAKWETRVTDEAVAIRKEMPGLVLSNISHLGIAAGVKAGCPAVAVASLSWDQVLAEYLEPGCVTQEKIVAQIRQAYQKAIMIIRPFPSIPMVAFPHMIDVGPILSAPVVVRGTVRAQLKVKVEERLVLIAFGGIPLSSLPLGQLESLQGYKFLMSGSFNCEGYSRILSTNSIGLSFREILAEADVVVTKPGYATILEAVQLQKPLVYVRRYNFVDEQSLVDFAHQYGQAIELTFDNFYAGEWRQALESVQMMPSSTKQMPPVGTMAAVNQLIRYI